MTWWGKTVFPGPLTSPSLPGALRLRGALPTSIDYFSWSIRFSTYLWCKNKSRRYGFPCLMKENTRSGHIFQYPIAAHS
jgi:hypothetical protein